VSHLPSFAGKPSVDGATVVYPILLMLIQARIADCAGSRTNAAIDKKASARPGPYFN
jgi:hypothetical protein